MFKKQHGKKTRGSLRTTAILMIFVVLMFLMLSVFFIAHEADHDCTGEDCPVCALIQMCEDSLRHLVNGAPAAAAAVLCISLILVMQFCMNDGIIISTPVSRKTRLNN